MSALPRSLTWGWRLWAAACLLLMAGTVANRIASRTYVLPLTLTPGASAETRVFRLGPDALRMQLAVERDANARQAPEGADGRLRAEKEGGRDRAEASGAIRVETDRFSGDFDIGAPTGHSARQVFRPLTPRPVQGDAAAVVSPARAQLPRGGSRLRVTVLDVELPLHGTAVVLDVEPPLGFKSTQSGYGALWPFFFWPYLAALLLVPGGVLAAATWRARRRSTR